MKKIDFKEIIENYYCEEYIRPLKYIDPRNVSKSGDTYLLNEHNQTVGFYNAVKKYYEGKHEVVAWFELSIGKNPPKKEGGRESTNAIDAIIYISGLDTLFIVEAKGLRKESKFQAILDDFNRMIGANRVKSPSDYKIQMKNPSQVYAITLADIWGEKTGCSDEWGIDFNNSNLTSIEKCKSNYEKYKAAIGERGELFSSDSFIICDKPYRLLAMVYEMTEEQICKYTFDDETTAK